MHPWRPIVVGGAFFAALAMLFPFVTFPVAGVFDGIAADAWPALLPVLPVVTTALVGDWSRGLRPMTVAGFAVLACLAVFYGVAKLTDAMLAVRDTEGASLGAGPIVLLGGTVIVLVGTLVASTRGFD